MEMAPLGQSHPVLLFDLAHRGNPAAWPRLLCVRRDAILRKRF